MKLSYTEKLDTSQNYNAIIPSLRKKAIEKWTATLARLFQGVFQTHPCF